MKVEYVNPFLESADFILHETAGLSTERGQLSVKDEVNPGYEVGVILGVTGQAKGQVIYSMSAETATGIASMMMGGMECNELDDMVRSAVGEMGNMITGRAVTSLDQMGISVNISPPTVVTGKQLRVSTLRIKTLVVPLKCKVGVLEINIGLET